MRVFRRTRIRREAPAPRSPDPVRETEFVTLEAVDPDSMGGGRHGRIREWSLVLQALFVPHRVSKTQERSELLVHPDWEERAKREIEEYASEEAGEPVPVVEPESLSIGATLLWTLAFTLLGLRIQAVQPFLDRPAWEWLEAGQADSALMLAGQWYRTVTALFLHADVGHLLANSLGLAVFVGTASRRLGPGPAWLLTLAAGILGNVLNAWIRGPGHLSIGGSTAVFGAVGILSGMAVSLDLPQRWTRAGVPVAAGLGMLAMLGTAGERTDLLAHLFGFVAGLALGWGAGIGLRIAGRPGKLFGFACGAMVPFVVAGAWFLALR
ncbi:MAG: rhomboid family intramembrane serine protease [Deltaproteobacteria bacterium]|nr:rhomboid family intramembrane serine protease [Deltaproteobacteria bacterium]